MISIPFTVVVRQDEMVAASRSWRQARALALDTEFVRERTYYPRPALIQVSDGLDIWLLDLVALEDLSPLRDVLFSEEACPILHAAAGDLEVLYHLFGSLPRSLFDTQVAAVFAGVGRSLSYQALVRELLGIEVEKNQTRTDWVARPLTPEQLAYAAEDVAHLLSLEQMLRDRLQNLGRWEWCQEDCRSLLTMSRFELDPGDAWEKIKGSGRLAQRQLAALRSLAAWREETARLRDLPRGFVIRDAALLDLARHRPTSPSELRRVPGLDRRKVRRDGARWLAAIGEAESTPVDDLPPVATRGRPPRRVQQLKERLRDRVQARADALALPADLLAPRAVLHTLALAADGDRPLQLPKELAGWREGQVGGELLETARRFREG